MAEEMQGADWIKTAVANNDSKSVIVTVNEGYQYQIYYDEQTGELGAYPVGPEDGHSMPKLKVSYDKVKGAIHVEASCEDEIKVIELRYKGEVVETKGNSGIAEFEVKETGWYEVKAICAKGKESYARIRVSNEILKPSIDITSTNEQENGWYGKDNKEVEVTINTDNDAVVGIYYKTNKDEGYTYQEGKSKVLAIKEVGRTIIYAYAVDKNGNESEIANKTIQYDNVKPVIDLSKVEIKEGMQEEGSEWYKTNVVLTLEKAITDEPQEVRIDGYYVWEITNEETPEEPTESNYLKGIDKQVKIETDGTHTLAFMAKDKAGNKSGIATLIIKKDSEAPRDFTPMIKDITNEGFTIVVGTSDDTSGIAGYNFYVGGEHKGSAEGENNKAVEYKVTGLSPNTSYLVTVEAKDKARNIKAGNNIAPVITKEAKEDVIIDLPAADGNNGWYKDNFNIEIRGVKTDENKPEIIQIIYTINGVEGTINGREGTATVTEEGENIVITAKGKYSDGSYSSVATKIIKKDSSNPNRTDITYVSHGTDTITVNTAAQDTISGISTIEYQYSTDGTNYETQTTKNYTGTTTVITNNYTYTRLTGNTKYWLRIKVTDMAGRITEGTPITQTTKAGLSSIELKIGAYVAYQPAATNPSSYSTTQDGVERSGSSEQTISRNSSLMWRVLKVDNTNGKLTLISETITEEIGLTGAKGYNNGVKLLNDACKTLYSNSGLGATGRSLNVDDINELMRVTPSIKLNSNYGNEFTPNKYRNYPNIFTYEKTGAPNEKYGTLLGLSEQSSWYNGTTLANVLKGKWTYYSYVLSTYIGIHTAQHAIATGKSDSTGSTTHTMYWLASRCASLSSDNASVNFSMFRVQDGAVKTYTLYTSGARVWGNTSAMRPCVEIDLSKVNIGTTGSGTRTDQYSITAE